MTTTNQLLKFSNGEIRGLKTLDEETLKKIDDAEEKLYLFDRDFRLLQSVLDNHTSFELELRNYLKESVNDISILHSIDFSKSIRLIDKWLLNILSSFKALIEHLETRITKNYGKRSNELSILKNAQSYEFDNEFSYAFAYKLRNYVQHCGIPQITITINSDQNISNEIQLSLEIDLHRDDLLSNYDSWGAVKDRLINQDEKICLLNIFDELMTSLLRIFSNIKELISYEEAKKARNTLLNIIGEDDYYEELNYGVSSSIQQSGEHLNMATRILKTKLIGSLNSFNQLIISLDTKLESKND